MGPLLINNNLILMQTQLIPQCYLDRVLLTDKDLKFWFHQTYSQLQVSVLASDTILTMGSIKDDDEDSDFIITKIGKKKT